MQKYLSKILFLLFLLFPYTVYAEGLEVKEVKNENKSQSSILTKEEVGYNFSVSFSSKNQETSYKVTLENTNSDSITISSIDIPNTSSLLSYSFSGIEEGISMKPGEKKEVLIKIKTTGDNNGSNIDENFLLNIHYDLASNMENPMTSVVLILFIGIIIGIVIVSLVFIPKIRKVFLFLLIIGVLAIGYQKVYALENVCVIRGHVLYKGTHTIEIDPNGGIYNGSSEVFKKKVLDGESIDLIVSRENYNLTHWTLNNSGTYEGNSIVVDKDMKLVANWEIVRYQVTIDPNGGVYNSRSDIHSVDVDAGSYYTVLNATRDRYEFVRWEINPSDKVITDNKVLVDHNISLKALWNQVYATLTIDPNGGSYNGYTTDYVTSHLISNNEVVTLLEPEKAGCTFHHWEKEDGTTYSGSTVTVNKDIKLKAIYEDILYNVLIDPNQGLLNGSRATVSERVKYSKEYNLSNIKRAGYVFKGWENQETHEVSYDITLVITENTSIKAQWIEAVCRIGEDYYESIADAIAAAQTGNTITLLKNTEENVTNGKNVIFDLNGYQITGSIHNTATGDLVLMNGVIENTTGTAIVNDGVLTLGVNDYKQDGSSNVLNENIIVMGKDIGIKQNNIFKFYDGYIEGDVALDGGYDDSPSYRNTTYGWIYYYPIVDHNNEKDCQHLELGSGDRAVTKTSVHGDIYYYNFQDNINTSARTGYAIYAIRSFNASYPITVAENTNIVFDIDGYEVTLANEVTNSGSLTFKDGKDYTPSTEVDPEEEPEEIVRGKILLSGVITNNGTFSVDSLTIEKITDTNLILNNKDVSLVKTTLKAKAGYAVYLNNESTFVMDADSELQATNYALFISQNVELVLNYGSIYGIETNGSLTLGLHVHNNGSNTAIKNNSNGRLIVNSSCVIESTNYGITNSGSLVFNEATIQATDRGISTSGSSVTELNGGTIVSTNRSGFYHGGGTVTIHNININSKNEGLYTQGRGTLVIENANIESTSSSGLSIGLYYNGSKTISGGTFKGKNGLYTQDYCDGMWCSSPSGVLNITGGTFIGTDYGSYHTCGTINVKGGSFQGNVYGVYNTKTISIGENDGEVHTDSPMIVGGTYGLYNTSVANFFDGILKGKTNSYRGDFSTLADATSIFTENQEIGEETYEVSYLITRSNFLRVGNQEFNSFASAVDAIEETGTIYVITNANYETAVTLPSGKNITFDLNGNTLTMTQTITNNGGLIITDSVGNGFLENRKNVMISNSSSGVLTINGGVISSRTSNAISSSGSLEINGGEIKGEGTSPTVSASGTIVLNGGTIRSINYSGLRHTGGTLTVNNITIYSKNDGIYDEGRGPLLIYDAYIESTTGNAINAGLYYGGGATIRGGTFIGNNGLGTNSTCTANFCSSASGTLTVYGGYFIGSTYGANITYRVANILGGTFKGNTYGMNNSVTVNIGQNDGTIHVDSPVIIGGTYGLYNTGTFNFYDGILKGTTYGYNGSFYLTPDGSVVTQGSETIDEVEYVTNYLINKPNFLRVGETEFNSLVDAIDFITDTDTMYLINSTTYETAATIPSGKHISFDLNGNSLSMTQTITNQGEFIINDSVGTGVLENTKNVMISSSGSLTINGGLISSKTSNTISSSGSLEINGGEIKGDGSSSTTITASGTIVLNGGTIRSTNSSGLRHTGGSLTVQNINIYSKNEGIYDEGRGTLNITNCNIESTNSNAITVGLYYAGTATIQGGTFKGKNGLYGYKYCTANSCNSPKGQLTVSGGSFVGTDNGASLTHNTVDIVGGTFKGTTYGINNSAVLNLGQNEGSLNTNSPDIIGGTYGVYNTGTLNFYDGILKGKTAAYNTNAITTIPNETKIVETVQEIESENYFARYLSTQGNIIKIGSSYYKSLLSAISAANAGDTMTVLEDFFNTEDITIAADKRFTIQLNGHEVTSSKQINNNGNVTIQNNSDNGKMIYYGSGYFITNKADASLTVNHARLEAPYVIQNAANGTLNTSNSTISSKNVSINNLGTYTGNGDVLTSDGTAFNNQGTFSIDNMNISGTTYGIYLNTTINNTIHNSTITSAGNAIYKNSTSTTTVDNATINGSIYNGKSDGRIDIQNSTVTKETTSAAVTLFQNKGTSYISNSTLSIQVEAQNKSATDYIILNTGTVSISDHSVLNITMNNTYRYRYHTVYGIKNSNNLVIDGLTSNIEGSTYSSSYSAYGIYQDDGVSIIRSGTVHVSGHKVYGLYIDGGSVTMGVPEEPTSIHYGKDTADVSIIDPDILASGISTGIGLKNNKGSFAYYDGIITGSTNALTEVPNLVEYLYEPIEHTDEETGNKYCVLEWMRNQNNNE